jgi:polyisoprenoid-binding protein YceI
MKKHLIFAASLAILASCKSNAPMAKSDPGTFVLDKSHSMLTAVAMKNETKAVELHFPGLDGSMTLSPFHATLDVAIDTLDTGDKVRDANVKNYFFEVAKAAMNTKASFELTKLEGDLASLKEGDSFPMKGSGTLNIHGASIPLSGPLSVTHRMGGGYSASFNDIWTVNIKDAGMEAQLANLNTNCPQPHRVGLNVAMKGEIVYLKQ